MGDRIASDHSSVKAVRSTCTETATGVRLEVPADERGAFPTDEVVRVALDGEELFARVERALTGDDLLIPGVYETPDEARDPSGATDRLWSGPPKTIFRRGARCWSTSSNPSFSTAFAHPARRPITTRESRQAIV